MEKPWVSFNQPTNQSTNQSQLSIFVLCSYYNHNFLQFRQNFSFFLETHQLPVFSLFFSSKDCDWSSHMAWKMGPMESFHDRRAQFPELESGPIKPFPSAIRFFYFQSKLKPSVITCFTPAWRRAQSTGALSGDMSRWKQTTRPIIGRRRGRGEWGIHHAPGHSAPQVSQSSPHDW